jgi:short-subunit dehydrogenase
VLWAQPERIARGIVRALERKRSTVYLPWFWRPIMFVVRSLPDSVFIRLSL